MGTSDRFPYETSTVLDQAFLDESFDSLTNQLELTVDIDSPIGTLHLSDRNKYVGGTFYEARLNFPVIERTIGELLSPTLEFSQLQLEINNADEKFNDILPSGSNYDGWVGRQIIVNLGLRDVASTYTEIFRGRVTDQGGFSRSVGSFTLVARNDFERVNVAFPSEVFKTTTYPDIEPDYENLVVPIAYGDWTINVQESAASVPCYPVNGNNVNVNGDTDHTVNIQCVITANANQSLDTSNIYLLRSDTFYRMATAGIVNVNATNNYFEIVQPNTTMIEGDTYQFSRGDIFYCRILSKDLGVYDNNAVEQARDILQTYGGVAPGDFDSNWNTFRDKAAPTESAIVNIKSRIWLGEAQEVLVYILSLLEQVRLEAFIDRNLKFKISSLHFDDFVPNPSIRIRNWDIAKDTFKPRIDDRNNFNRAKGSFNFLPNLNENYQETKAFRNDLAIVQDKKAISKRVVYPNLYVTSDVEDQLRELLRLVSSKIEFLEFEATWKLILLDISDFVKINVDIQSTQYEDVPAVIRDIGFDPDGLKTKFRMWSFQLLPFPGYEPGFPGTVGGYAAIITEE